MVLSTAQKLRVESRRSEVASLKLKFPKLSTREIAKRLGSKVSWVTIAKDLHALHEQWKANSKRDFDRHMGEELAALDELISETREAWEKSKEESFSTTRTGRKRRNRDTGKMENEGADVSVHEAKQVGNPAYMSLLIQLHVRKQELLGLRVDTKDSQLSTPPVVQILYNTPAGTTTGQPPKEVPLLPAPEAAEPPPEPPPVEPPPVQRQEVPSVRHYPSVDAGGHPFLEDL
jgi:hypothetical protein